MASDSAPTVKESAPVGLVPELGDQLRQARKSRCFSQRALAAAADVDLATVKRLERGKGTVGPLCSVLNALDHRFAHQPPDAALGPWMASVRKAAGYSQARLAVATGLSKPTIIQTEHGRGNLQSLLQVMRVLRMEINITPSADALLGAQLFLGDCLEILPGLPDHSVHAIIADLPYSLTILEWDQPIPLEPLWEQFRRVLKPNGVVVLTASQPFTTMLAASNLPWLKYSLIWEKTRPTGFLQARGRPLKKHEDILVFSLAKTIGEGRSKNRMTYNPQDLIELSTPVRSRNGKMANGGLVYNGRYDSRLPNTKLHGDGSMFNGDCIRGGGRHQTHTNYPTSILRFASASNPTHPTQKSLELFRYLVRTFSNEGETVLDCCFGSGTTGVAAVLEGRKFIGVEREAAYFKMAQERIVKAKAGLYGKTISVPCKEPFPVN